MWDIESLQLNVYFHHFKKTKISLNLKLNLNLCNIVLFSVASM